jgi:Outer membrane protein beta-barrel domain
MKQLSTLMFSFLIFGSISLLSTNALGDDNRFGAGFELIGSHANLENVPFDATIDDAGGFAIYGKYRVNPDWVAEGGYQLGGSGFLSFGLDNNFSFATYFLRAGYEWRLGESFAITPQLGLHQTTVELTEGFFLNPGPEDTSEDSSFDLLYGLKFGVSIQRLELFFRIQRIDLDIGDISQQSLGAEFFF